MKRIGVTSSLLLMTAALSCDAPPPPKTRLPIDQVGGTAVLRGIVKFVGTSPERKVLENKPCHAGAGVVVDDTVIVNPNGTLANVFVYVIGLPATRNEQLPAKTLDQINCQYAPHVVGIAAGQTLHVMSSDPCVHNVHLDPQKNPAINLTMQRAGESAEVKFENAEFIKSTCDVHPWMGAWVGVFENPYYAVTDAAGAFEITGLPAGTYRVATWHELYGPLAEQQVTFDAATPSTVQFVYEPGK